jgi:heme/copper-type cytochrome/quinol oxidase subunit 2
MNILRKFTLLIALLLLSQPVSLLACSTCYGAPDAPMSKGLVWGITVLLGVVGTVLAGVATFFVYVVKRSPTPPDGSVDGSDV